MRGCVKRGEHFAGCSNYGRAPVDAECRGCVPVEAREGALICDRDYRRLRRLLDDAPDLIGLIRSKADPSKSGWNMDREIVGGSRADLAPAPVDADLVDAGEQLTSRLAEWSRFLRHGVAPLHRAPGLAPGAGADVAHALAREYAVDILDRLDDVVNDRDNVLALCSWTLDQWIHDELDRSEEDRSWTLTRALNRWSLVERAWWAAQPCPNEDGMGGCGLKSVRVFPPRTPAGRTRFVCQSPACDWERDDTDDDAPWALMFSHRMGQPGFVPEEPLEDVA
ncbi:hypothetical protein QWJ90_01400 [Microbacterium oryzae]|uniref:hypothetical protein n=1 Tax=Microbacterium oryzae TaxID=743009 RepID=UPI0025B0F85D|nr:hypothetical protein [Microbacterium oryzae]MDN3309578.1 hypothetical protein [Microbacterium oryzae]